MDVTGTLDRIMAEYAEADRDAQVDSTIATYGDWSDSVHDATSALLAKFAGSDDWQGSDEYAEITGKLIGLIEQSHSEMAERIAAIYLDSE